MKLINTKSGILLLLLSLSSLSIANNKRIVIHDLAVHGLDSANLKIDSNRVVLYGIRTNGPDTKDGDWACAKVASIILNKAGTGMPIVLGVGKMEELMKGWTKITDEDSLQNGDVIVWTSRLKGRDDLRCTGSGNCHVGIVTERGYYHNNPLGNSPMFNGLGLIGFKFKVGYRF